MCSRAFAALLEAELLELRFRQELLVVDGLLGLLHDVDVSSTAHVIHLLHDFKLERLLAHPLLGQQLAQQLSLQECLTFLTAFKLRELEYIMLSATDGQ